MSRLRIMEEQIIDILRVQADVFCKYIHTTKNDQPHLSGPF